MASKRVQRWSENRRFLSGVTTLEDRVMMATGRHPFAHLAETLGGAGVSGAAQIQIGAPDFVMPRGRVLLDLSATVDNASPKPGSLRVATQQGTTAKAFTTKTGVAGDLTSTTLASFGRGTYALSLASPGGSGSYQIDASLVGDIDGDFRVTRDDFLLIRSLSGIRSEDVRYLAAADANHNGIINNADLTLAQRNRGVSTTVRPLATTIALAADTPRDSLGRVTSTSVILVGRTKPGAAVALDLDTDSLVDLITTAGPDGAFQFALYSRVGIRTQGVEVTDSFGQRQIIDLTYERIDDSAPTPDTKAPIVIVTSPASGLFTNINPTISGTVVDDRVGVSTLVAEVDGSAAVDVPVAVNGSFQFTPALATDNTADGAHSVRFRARDAAGNDSAAMVFNFTLDTVAPSVVSGPTGLLNDSLSSLTVAFSEAIIGANTSTSYTLLSGSTPVPIASVTSVDGKTFVLNLAAPLPNGAYQLSLGAGLTDRAGNSLIAAEPFAFTVARPVGIASLSPSNGEELVSLTRETVVRFDDAVDPVTITPDSFYLIAKGARIPGTIRVSPTERFALFFYDTPLPESTEVRVVVDGDKIMGRDGLAIDGNGDGQPGGMATADFSTLPLTFIPGTSVFGYIYDSYNAKPDGMNIPVVGATITLDAQPGVFAVTDANGFFELGVQDLDGDGKADGLPSPELFVHIDGTTATNAPAGMMYARLGKPFHTIPGQRVQLEMDGSTFNIFLPPMAEADVVALDPTADTTVGFGSAGKAQLSALFPDLDPAVFDRLQVVYPAGSAQSQTGSVATRATVIPVNPNRLPAPLPPNVAPKLVISIQAGDANGFNIAGGPSNFLTPAPVTFPNLDGLAPGEKSLIWSFDHDAGRWIVLGNGTVSADGLTIASDPGIGILAPGWHFTNPGTTGDGDQPEKDPDWEDIAKILNDDYGSKIGTVDAALAHQIACLAQVACNNVGSDGWGSGWVKDTLENIARDSKANRHTTGVPEWLPNAVAAVWGGFFYHFPNQLLPSFIENCDRLSEDSDGDGRTDHEEFFEDAVVPCFDEVYKAGELGITAKTLAQLSVPLSAAALRESVIAYCGVRDRLQSLDELLGDAARLLNEGFEAFEYAGEVYRNLKDFADRLGEGIPPLGDGLPPLPFLDQSFYDIPTFKDLGDFVINGAGDFFLGVGSVTQLNLSNFGLRSITAAAATEATEYYVYADPSVATIDSNGVLKVHGTNVAYRNMSTPLLVAVRRGDQVGYGQFAIRDIDTDRDGLVDSYERSAGLDPLVANSPGQDSDNDGLTDAAEAGLGTSSILADTDRDGVSDSIEIASRSDPYANAPTPFSVQRSVFYLLEDLDTGFVQRGKTGNTGRLTDIFMSADTKYRYSVLDPQSLRSGSSEFQTGASGSRVTIASPQLSAVANDDVDGDGLNALAERILGTSSTEADSDGDGISDSTELAQGLNPLDNRGFPTGMIASLTLPGSAEAVEVVGDRVYVATGSHGLAILDGSRFDRPILLGQIDLSGTATDVGVDSVLNLAAIATGTTLQIVDVSDPMVPVNIGGVGVGASKVEVFGGLAYAVSGTSLRVIDLATRDVVQSLTLPGSGSVTGLAREGTYLYAFISGSDTLAIVDIATQSQAKVVGQMGVSIASTDVGLFVGNGIAWLSGSGLRTVDVSNAASPKLMHGADSFFTARRLTLNGSGLGLLAPDGGRFIQVYDTSNPNDTDTFLTQFPLSGPARDVAISRGIAYVAAGGRLEVVNYRPFDTNLQAPTVSISTPLPDADPTADGNQVLEGATIPIRVAALDDVQVRQVELLVNGIVVQTDVSFPFDFAAVAPNLAAGVNSITIQVRATDTGGNVGLSNILTLQIIPDTTPPTIVSQTPVDGGRVFEGNRTLRVRFSEPVLASVATTANFRIVGAGPDGLFGTGDDFFIPATVSLADGDRLVQIAAPNLTIGSYRLIVQQDAITDRAGNVLGVGTLTTSFAVEEQTSVLTGRDVVFVIDISGSTGSGFGGTPVGDVNGDGSRDTILDVELAAIVAINQEMINLKLGTIGRVAIVTFSTGATILDIDPATAGVQVSTSPLADTDGNGTRDVEQTILGIRQGGSTEYEAALQKAIEAFTEMKTVQGEGNLIFLSDGEGSGSFLDEIATLEGMGVNRLAYGVGSGASLTQLTQIDRRARRFTSIDELLGAFLGISDN